METETLIQANDNENFNALQQRVKQLLSLDFIREKDLEGMTQLERQYFSEIVMNRLNNAKEDERDRLERKIAPILSQNSNDSIRDDNHEKIHQAVSNYMIEYGVMPTKSAIAAATGLSRATIRKHLNDYHRQPEAVEEMEQFRSMVPNVLANVYKTAVKGDIKAARLFLQTTTGKKTAASTVVNTQNNYIQINNTILSQENLNRLTAQQLDQIESIIASCVAPVKLVSG